MQQNLSDLSLQSTRPDELRIFWPLLGCFIQFKSDENYNVYNNIYFVKSYTHCDPIRKNQALGSRFNFVMVVFNFSFHNNLFAFLYTKEK